MCAWAPPCLLAWQNLLATDASSLGTSVSLGRLSLGFWVLSVAQYWLLLHWVDMAEYTRFFKEQKSPPLPSCDVLFVLLVLWYFAELWWSSSRFLLTGFLLTLCNLDRRPSKRGRETELSRPSTSPLSYQGCLSPLTTKTSPWDWICLFLAWMIS